MTCNNCSNDAVYRIDDPGADEVDYCRPCLPLHLLSTAQNYVIEPVVEDPKPTKK